MRQYFFLITGVIILLEFYVYQAIKNLTNSPYIRLSYIAINLVIYALFVYHLLSFGQENKTAKHLHWFITLFLAFMLPKIIASLFLLIDDIFRGLQIGIQYATKSETHIPERRKFLSLMGLGIAGTLSALFLDGVLFGKYRHKVRHVKLKIKNLPQQFKGYKIIQISDVHSGSFLNPDKLKPAIDLINQQQADLILCTGDMVNNKAEEFQALQHLFASMKAKDGKFSVLGNHDYGDYIEWESPEAKAQNIPNLIQLQKEAGFTVLLNEHRAIEKNGEKIYLIGVENWGEKPFPQYGDLDKATAGIPTNAAKILMSHDPTHFDKVVKKHPSDIALTLSGHTHGMQFGLDLKNVKWSPVQYRYKKWADLYESENKYLYVNRGFGVIAYPGRVGMLPEITLLELS